MNDAIREPQTRTRVRGSRHNAVVRAQRRGAWVMLTPFLVLFLVAAAMPISFAVYTSLQKPSTLLNPQEGFGGLESFAVAVTDYRFIESFRNIFTVMAIWLPIMILGIVGLALLIHASPGLFGRSMRFIYYIPGSLAGIANFMLWVYLINPQTSPIVGLWSGIGASTIKDVASIGNVPFILAAMLFFQGVGTWMIIVNGGLNSIPDEIFEAASLDGANAWQLTWRVKIPLIRPWIGYAVLMNLAYGFQLFLEPFLLDQVTAGSLPDHYTPTQLAYAFAFTSRNLPSAAALSLILLVITLAIGLLVVFRSGLFGDSDNRD